MSFQTLYNSIQNLQTPIKSKFIIQETKNLKEIELEIIVSGIEDQTSLNPEICKGYYFSPKNKNHQMYKAFSDKAHIFKGDVIVLSRRLNDCWYRFVKVKEAMHCFGQPEQRVFTGELFEELLNSFASPSSQESAPYKSEIEACWMALAVLCPESVRSNLKTQFKENKIDEYGIAVKLKIPQAYVPALLSDEFSRNLKDILARY